MLSKSISRPPVNSTVMVIVGVDVDVDVVDTSAGSPILASACVRACVSEVDIVEVGRVAICAVWIGW